MYHVCVRAVKIVVCCAESTTWRRGNERGMFPGEAMCNSHGTLDMRGRLHLYLNKVCLRQQGTDLSFCRMCES